MPKPSQKTVETDALRIHLIQRGITVESLALACGLKRTTMSNAIAENVPGRRLRIVLEDVLKLPLWSSLADFEARQQLARLCGYNPALISLIELRQRVSTLKLRGRSRARRKTDLIALLHRHFTTINNHSNPHP
jgi:lambda repressor-like predicted transcriptional regulator